MSDIDLDQLTTDIEKLSRWRYKNFVGSENFDDAVQEGKIWAWRQIEKGAEDRGWVLNSSVRHVWNHLHPETHHQPTGHERITGGFGVANTDTRARMEKVDNFILEFGRLHDRKPGTSEIARGTGLQDEQVRRVLRRLSDRDNTALTFNSFGRVSSKNISLSVLMDVKNDGDSADSHEAFSMPSFEDGAVSELDFQLLLSKLSDIERRVIVLRHVYGYTETMIGREVGHSQSTVNRLLRFTHKKLRAIITGEPIPVNNMTFEKPTPKKVVSLVKKRKPGRPMTTHCRKCGLERTPENTLEYTKPNGGVRRLCAPCTAKNKREYDARRKAQG